MQSEGVSGWYMRPDVRLHPGFARSASANSADAVGFAAAESVKTGRHGRHGGAPRGGAGRSFRLCARRKGSGALLCVLGLAVVSAVAAVVLLDERRRRARRARTAGTAGGGGVFLIFGLLSGFLRVSERAMPSEIVKPIADGLDGGLQIVDQGGVLYRNRALQRLTAGARAGMPRSRSCWRASRIRRRPSSASTARPSAATSRRGALCSPAAGSGRGGRWLRVGVRPSMLPSHRPDATADAVAGRRTSPRAHARDRDGSGLEATLAFYDSLPQGLLAVAPDGRIAHINATLAQWLGLRTESGRTLTLLDFVSADGAALIRAVARGAAGPHDAARARSAARGRPRVSGPARLPRSRARGIISVLVLERTGPAAPGHPGGDPGAPVAALPLGPVRHRYSRSRRPHRHHQRRLHPHVLDEERAAPTAVANLLPPGQEEAGRALAKALERAISGRAGAPASGCTRSTSC